MKSPTMLTNTPPGLSTTIKNIHRKPLACGLAIAAIGLSPAIASASLITVQNGGFEDPTPHNPNNETIPDWTAGGWAFVGAPWTTSTGNYGRISTTPMVGTAQPGPWIMNLNDTGGWVKQDLGTTVNVGDTLSVTFSVMSDSEFGAIDASFLVGPTPAVYHLNFDTSDNGHSLNTWYDYTFTTAPITEAGNLSLQFSQVSGRLWLDNVSDVSVNLTAIPEPGSLLALGCLIGSAALLRNRRR